MNNTFLTPREAQHLHWRAGFGVPPLKWQEKKFDLEEELEQIFIPVKFFEEIKTIPTEKFDEMSMQPKEMASMQTGVAEKKDKAFQGGVSFDFFKLMNNPKNTFREKMSLFWLNLFACQPETPLAGQQFLNTIRKNALGDFKTLLREVVKHPVMLHYLSARRNKKQSPNENLARELMELFTLGRGNYTEGDVKEASRALTGWSYKDSSFKFEANFHDLEEKTIFGKRGNFDGDSLLDLILSKYDCAHYVTNRICKEFINYNISPSAVKIYSKIFFDSGYDICKLMRTIFTSKEFYKPENTGTQIKSPFDLLAGIALVSDLKFNNSHIFLDLQRNLGQEIFKPPNVAGWATGKGWINNNTLTLRLNLPDTFFKKKKLSFMLNNSLNQSYNNNEINNGAYYVSDWSSLNLRFNHLNSLDLPQHLLDYLIPSDLKFIDTFLPLDYSHSINPTEVAIKIMSLPEYQLC
ncbi:MAG TPA: DUF1800 domain-containing protein [Bacteroidia bacterium]|nr:DUF1800 domain-containing protein [Bacteroidia bacterium]HNU32473.1 DUF1800 domain-containing protein [Bacteroidia bacterium]